MNVYIAFTCWALCSLTESPFTNLENNFQNCNNVRRSCDYVKTLQQVRIILSILVEVDLNVACRFLMNSISPEFINNSIVNYTSVGLTSEL